MASGNPCQSSAATVYYGAPGIAGTASCQITVNGVKRKYRLHIPASYVPGQSAIILSFHGHGTGMDGANQEIKSQLSPHSDKYGYAVVYPDSTTNVRGKNAWNIYELPTEADDVGFIRALTQYLISAISPDPKRIYISGFSGGAMFTHVMATHAPDLFAAGAPESGVILVASGTQDPLSYPMPALPISMILVNGVKDTAMIYCGLLDMNSAGVANYVPSVEDTFHYWAVANDCQSFAPAAPLCVAGAPNPGILSKKATQCANGVEVEVVAHGASVHQWFPQDNDKIWAFFMAHPKP